MMPECFGRSRTDTAASGATASAAKDFWQLIFDNVIKVHPTELTHKPLLTEWYT